MLPDCFADETAIDFPSVGTIVERMRDAFFGERDDDVIHAEVLVSNREAGGGLIVPIEVPVRGTCPRCGGRGEIWTERCGSCLGSGEAVFQQRLRVSVPPGVADGACFRFRVSSPDSVPVRVEVRVAIRSSAS